MTFRRQDGDGYRLRHLRYAQLEKIVSPKGRIGRVGIAGSLCLCCAMVHDGSATIKCTFLGAAMSKPDKTDEPFVVFVLEGLSWLSILGGLSLALVLKPGEPGDGYSWKVGAYVPMIIAFTAGVVQGALFASLSKVVAFLSRIEFNTRKCGATNESLRSLTDRQGSVTDPRKNDKELLDLDIVFDGEVYRFHQVRYFNREDAVAAAKAHSISKTMDRSST